MRRSGKLRAALWIGGILGVAGVALVLSWPRGRIDVDMGREEPLLADVPNLVGRDLASTPRPSAPSLVGKDLAGAREALRSSNLALGQTSYGETARYAAGTVISQSPAAGTELEAGATVDVVLATPPAAVAQQGMAVPNLMGMDSGSARRALQSRNLSLGQVSSSETDQRRPGTVIAQSPSAGAQLAAGAPVSLIVAKETTRDRSIQADVVVGFVNADDPTHGFKKTDDGTWGEFQNEPSPKFVFRERGRDRTYITIWDDGRNLGIRLPLTGDFIELNQDGTWRNQWPARRVTQRLSTEIVGGQLLACAGRTGEQGADAKLVIQNSSTRAIKVYWVNDSGAEILYQSLAPRQSYEQPTYVNHRWCIRDADSGSEIAGFLPTQAISRVGVR